VTDQDAGSDDASTPWWQDAAEGLPDLDALLGEEGMEAVGTVADEALKLFVVLRERFVEAGTPQSDASAESAAPATPWASVLGQLAATAIQAVNDLAASAGQAVGPLPTAPLKGFDSNAAEGERGADEGPAGAGAGSAGAGRAAPMAGTAGEPVVLPGEAAACSYCPICQAISLFRSVPMSTWQRLAASIVEVADAAREFTNNAPQQPGPEVVTPHAAPATAGPVSIADVLADLAEPSLGDEAALEDPEPHDDAGAG
jgi:hypothetical protein